MTWHDLCDEFLAVWWTRRWGEIEHRLRGDAARLFRTATPAEREWLAPALEDERRKWFAAFVLDCAGTLPRRFFEPVLRAAVYEVNPSNNRVFVDLCLRSRGTIATVERLLEYVEGGSDFEKAGAASALYWAWGHSTEGITRDDEQALEALAARQRELLLREFVRNASLDVRRSIISKLSLDSQNDPPELKRLVAEAVRVAREEGDDYIRHRLQIQFGCGGPLPSLPHRERPA